MSKKFGCNEIAQAIKSIMAIANFSGFINQEAGTELRQFDVTHIDGDNEKAVFCFTFAGQSYKAEITLAEPE